MLLMEDNHFGLLFKKSVDSSSNFYSYAYRPFQMQKSNPLYTSHLSAVPFIDPDPDVVRLKGSETRVHVAKRKSCPHSTHRHQKITFFSTHLLDTASLRAILRLFIASASTFDALQCQYDAPLKAWRRFAWPIYRQMLFLSSAGS